MEFYIKILPPPPHLGTLLGPLQLIATYLLFLIGHDSR